jgi:disulfide bond formation protein DsbB
MTRGLKPTALLLAVASLVALATAYGSQYFGGLHPCVLCLYQRIPHAVVAALGILAALPFVSDGQRRLLVALIGIALLTGAGIAGFHHGVEQLWWEGTSDCSAALDTSSFEAFRAQILGNPVVRCDEVPWSLFGLSMASYNFIASLVLAAVAFLGLARDMRKETA